MMRRPLFFDIDTQIDFMRADGHLAVPGAEAIVGNLARLTELARAGGVPIVHTADDHDLGDGEISASPDWVSTFPPHCLHGTAGAERIPETRESPGALLVAWDGSRVDRPGPDELNPLGDIGDMGFICDIRDVVDIGDVVEIVVAKKRFDVFSNPATAEIVERLDPSTVVVYGVALDVCVKHAVDGLLALGRDTEIVVVTDAVAALDAQAGEALLARWAKHGVRRATTAEVGAELTVA
jgi:nicotinamidase/pyrazinamidase